MTDNQQFGQCTTCGAFHGKNYGEGVYEAGGFNIAGTLYLRGKPIGVCALRPPCECQDGIQPMVFEFDGCANGWRPKI